MSDDALTIIHIHRAPSIELVRACMADGSSDSYMSGGWAKCICDKMVMDDSSVSLTVESFAKEVAKSRAWRNLETNTWRAIRKNIDDGKVIGISQAERMSQGSSATMLAIELVLDEGGPPLMSVGALGDTCLFLVREFWEGGDKTGTRKNIVSFPIQESISFSIETPLISSVLPLNEGVSSNLKTLHDEKIVPGDLVLAMTDALAKWYLVQIEQGREPWNSIVEKMGDEASFNDWISELRRMNVLRNDDVTVLSIMVKN